MKRALAERAKQETEENNRNLGISASEIPLKSPSPPILSHSSMNHETDFLKASSLSSVLSEKIPRITSSTHTSVSSPQGFMVDDCKIPLATVSSATPTSTFSEGHTDMTMISPQLSISSSQVTGQQMMVNHSSLPQSVISTPVTATVQLEPLIPFSSASMASILKNPKKRSRSLTALTSTPYASTSAYGAVEVLSNIHPTVDGEDSAATDNGKGFYLIHQNRALASELFQYKRIIHLLEEERSIRREECHKIGQVIGSMISSWIETETILVAYLQSQFVSLSYFVSFSTIQFDFLILIYPWHITK